MLPEIETLLILQDRDLKLRRLRLELKKAPEDEARAKSRLASDEANLKAAKDATLANEVAMKKLDLDIGTRQTTIVRLKQQQFETRKNEEYRAIEHELARYGAEISNLEDEQLILMEKAEALKDIVTKAQHALEATKKLVADELEQLAQRQIASKAQIANLETERSEITAKLDSSLVVRYDRLFANKAPAVVPMENGICGGCHMKLTATTNGAVKLGKVITNCEQCGRVLYRGD